MVEEFREKEAPRATKWFQSAGRIIGWLKAYRRFHKWPTAVVSIRRADYWLVEVYHYRRARRLKKVSIRRADYWLVEVYILRLLGGEPEFQSAGRIIGWLKLPVVTIGKREPMEFQSAGRIIGWLKPFRSSTVSRMPGFQSAGRIIGWLKICAHHHAGRQAGVSIRRADYWLVEVRERGRCYGGRRWFQSAGRIIGWLKSGEDAPFTCRWAVSIRRADYWLVEVPGTTATIPTHKSFNPPGGLLVG